MGGIARYRQTSATHTIYDVSPYFHVFTLLSAEKCDNLHFSAVVSAKMAIIPEIDKFCGRNMARMPRFFMTNGCLLPKANIFLCFNNELNIF